MSWELTKEDNKTLDTKIHNSLNYLYQTYPTIYEWDVIYENCETLVDVTSDINRIKRTDHPMITMVYRWCWEFYLKHAIADQDANRQRGNYPLELKLYTHYQAYTHMKIVRDRK